VQLLVVSFWFLVKEQRIAAADLLGVYKKCRWFQIPVSDPQRAPDRDSFTRRGYDERIHTMNRIGILLSRLSLLLLLVAAPAVLRAIAQQWQESVPPSLVSFSAEDDKFADAVPLSDCVRQLLAADEHVVNTPKYDQLPAEQLPADWFTASRAELGEHSGIYFVVMGAGVMPGCKYQPFLDF